MFIFYFIFLKFEWELEMRYEKKITLKIMSKYYRFLLLFGFRSDCEFVLEIPMNIYKKSSL